MAVAFLAPNFANTTPLNISTSKAVDEIKELILKIDFDQSTMTIDKAKIYFMINSNNEIIVIQTSSDEIDNKVKSTLNYKTLKNRDLLVNKVYTLPIRFNQE